MTTCLFFAALSEAMELRWLLILLWCVWIYSSLEGFSRQFAGFD
jgi:hypothetical protein